MTQAAGAEGRRALDRMHGRWARAWGEVAARAAEELGPEWLLSGRGGSARLTRPPVGWWLPQIGFNPGSSGLGELVAFYRPLTQPVRPVIDHRQGHHPGEQPRRGFDPRDRDALATVLWWAQVVPEALFGRRSESERVADAERRFALDPQGRPVRWPMIAGWRVILGTGSPVAVIDAVLELIDADSWPADERGFWTAFRAQAVGGDRVGTLQWLDDHRRAGLAAAKVPDAAVVAVVDRAPAGGVDAAADC